MSEIKAKASTLPLLLKEDGYMPTSESGDQFMYHCFNPNHQDDNPSLAVNVTKGLYHCFGCGIKGNSYHYLTEYRNLDKAAAMKLLKENYGWSDERIEMSEEKRKQAETKRQGLPNIYQQLPEKNVVATHDYNLPNGALVCRVLRFKQKVRGSKREQPKTISYTPRSKGGWWCCSPINEHLPEIDKRVGKHPLYRVEHIVKQVGKVVWIVEGEKCADTLARAKDHPTTGPVVATSVRLGKTADGFKKNDFEPLRGRKLFLVSDQDEVGRVFMKRLGDYLVENISPERLTYCLPEGQGGYDIHDKIAESGFKGAVEWIKSIGVIHHSDLKKMDEGDDEGIDPDHGLVKAASKYFEVLGMDDDCVALKNKSTSLIVFVKATTLCAESTLNTLAPLNFWYENCGGKDEFVKKHTRLAIQDALMRKAEAKGVFDASTAGIGRGAFLANGHIYYNTGVSLLRPNPSGYLADETDEMTSPQEGQVLLGGPKIALQDDDKSEQWCKDLFNSLIDYRWESARMGYGFIGWIVTSLVGGALGFRPVVWLNAPATTGKSYLLGDVLSVLLRGVLMPIYDITEAALARLMKNDSLPAYFDEFEPKKGSTERWENILALMRMATSGVGYRVRAKMKTGGGDSVVQPRFSLLFSSINRPELSEADESRFFVARLSRKPVDDWPQVDKRIKDAIKPNKCIAMRTHIIRNTAKIVALAEQKSAYFANLGKNTREAKLLGALSAGASFMSGNESLLVVRDAVDEPVSQWLAPLQIIMDSHVRLNGSTTHTIGEMFSKLVEYKLSGKTAFTDERERMDEFKDTLERYGLLLKQIKRGGVLVTVQMYIASDNQPLKDLMSKTFYANIDLNVFLGALPEVEKMKNGKRLRSTFGGVRKPCLALPEKILIALGLLPDGGFLALVQAHSDTYYERRQSEYAAPPGATVASTADDFISFEERAVDTFDGST